LHNWKERNSKNLVVKETVDVDSVLGLLHIVAEDDIADISWICTVHL
jgi:hypothetical protein